LTNHFKPAIRRINHRGHREHRVLINCTTSRGILLSLPALSKTAPLNPDLRANTKVSRFLDFRMTSHRWVSGSAPASGAPPRALAGQLEKPGQRPLEVLQVGRGAHPTAPEGGRAPRDRALPRHCPKTHSYWYKNPFSHRQYP
jgi:hypothetical protein